MIRRRDRQRQPRLIRGWNVGKGRDIGEFAWFDWRDEAAEGVFC